MKFINSRKRLLKNCSLYLVLDKDTAKGRDLFKLAKSAILGGVDILQLRWKGDRIDDILKTGKKIRILTKRFKIPFIVNDDVILAKLLNADGIHTGQKDIPIKKARFILGAKKIIGVSTHNSAQAKKAALDGADYISIGPVFKTPFKAHFKPLGSPNLKKIKQKIGIPVFAIGGINLRNLSQVIEAGAKRIAVIRAIVKAKNPKEAARTLKAKLNQI